MLKNVGVYTIKCPKCSRSTPMHLASDGSFSPNKCPQCHLEFAGIDNGEKRNTFVVIVKTEKSRIVANESAKEIPTIEEKPIENIVPIKKTTDKSFETIVPIKKATDPSFETFLPSKKSSKKSFKW